ncbi:MAG TPA: hypothetical protein VFI22_13500 [Thermomicrobiales bacterium]|nr:hypothetical protein [Thermomicrobiales bacterium]
MTGSGGGVNLKLMPNPDGAGTIPMRASFSFDAHYAQCAVEDVAQRFAMDTFGMGRVVIEPHTFFMAMDANDVNLTGIYDLGGGKRMAKLTGNLGCSTEAGTASATVGSRTTQEPAFFEIAAVDGGHGGGEAGDTFAFTVYFDQKQAPVNYGIFGSKFTFTGEMIAGEVTVGPPVTLPLLPGPPPGGTPPA